MTKDEILQEANLRFITHKEWSLHKALDYVYEQAYNKGFYEKEDENSNAYDEGYSDGYSIGHDDGYYEGYAIANDDWNDY